MTLTSTENCRSYPRPSEGYDFIGDVHGCATTLYKLLDSLGYEPLYSQSGQKYYQYRLGRGRRMAVFVGDLIDRGPRIVEAVSCVKAMMENGCAVCLLGNHELHAILYATQLSSTPLTKNIKSKGASEKDAIDGGVGDPNVAHQTIVSADHSRTLQPVMNADIASYDISEEQEFLVRHSKRRAAVIEQTLTQYQQHELKKDSHCAKGVDDTLWAEHLEWFRSLPIWLENPDCRAVHACWHDSYVRLYKNYYQSELLTDRALVDMADYTSVAYRAIDTLTRGIQLTLPNGVSMPSEFGGARKKFRTRFWDTGVRLLADLSLQPDPLPSELSTIEVSDVQRSQLVDYPSDSPLLFIGHYWLNGDPSPLKDNIICLDYSAVKGGSLVAYRHHFNEPFDSKHFVVQANIE